MFIEKYPLFKKDMILKADMLVNLREYPREMFYLQYADYSDGILTGTRVKIIDNTLLITPGILKQNGKLYYMEAETKIPYEATGQEQILKIRFLEEEKHSDFIICRSEIVLEEAMELMVNEVELCRFTLKTGAALRQDYQDLSDFSTLHNTVNILHVKYAGHNKPTISPEITAFFGKELFRYHPENPGDVSFGMLCLNEMVIERNLIEIYLSERLSLRDSERYSNIQIHENLVRVLDNVKNGRSGSARGDGRGRRMIVE